MDEWWVGTIHLWWLHLLAGEESSPNTGACRWSSLSWPLGDRSEVVGRWLLQLQRHAHMCIQKTRAHGAPMARIQAQSRLLSNLLSFTPPHRRFLPWASPPSGEFSFIPLWPSFMRCSVSFESIVIFKFLRWPYTLPIFLNFLKRHHGKGPIKPVILNHILQRAKHRWSSIFWDRNLRISSGICFCSLPPNSLKFKDEVQTCHLDLWGFTKIKFRQKNVLKCQWPWRYQSKKSDLCLSIESCSVL